MSTPEQILALLESKAKRYETPCGDGMMVWRVWGAEHITAPPLVLLHGASGYWAHWARNIEVLSASRPVWIPDMPGMGESALPERKSHEGIVTPIAEGLKELVNADLPINVVGFSFGGVIACQLALLYPEVVQRIIIVGSGGLDTPLGDFAIKRLKGLDPAARRAAAIHNLLEIMIYSPDRVDELALWIERLGPKQARFQVVELVMPDHIIRILPDLSVRIDAIYGEFDRGHPAAGQEPVLRYFRPDMDFRTIPNAGHWCIYEQADIVNETLIEMLG